MQFVSVVLCLLLSSSQCLDNVDKSSVHKDLISLFHSSTLSPVNDVSVMSVENFAEGGSHNSDKVETSTAKTLNQNSTSSIDLANGVASGTSGSKPRKGVHAKIIVARKGAPPCLEAADCKPLTAVPVPTESSPPPVYESNISNVFPHDGAKLGEVLPKKPKITLIPLDSDAIYDALKSERNVVIPIVALVSAPLIVMILLIFYKRYRDSRDNTQYMRMGFLIEDIYND